MCSPDQGDSPKFGQLEGPAEIGSDWVENPDNVKGKLGNQSGRHNPTLQKLMGSVNRLRMKTPEVGSVTKLPLMYGYVKKIE